MWGLIVIHSKQVFRFNCVHYNEVPLYCGLVVCGEVPGVRWGERRGGRERDGGVLGAVGQYLLHSVSGYVCKNIY